MQTKTKPVKKIKTTQFVYIVMAYKISSLRYSNSLYVEVFSNKNAADVWEDAVRADGFTCIRQKKLLNK
jgi:hypothetical protein